MIKLNLIRVDPPDNECHLVAFILGLLGLAMAYLVPPSEGLANDMATGFLTASCWYVYKVFDGITYDDQVTLIGTMVGFLVIGLIGHVHFF